jgi:hypothetical protein
MNINAMAFSVTLDPAANNGEHAGPLLAITQSQAPHASRDVVPHA